MRSGGAAAEADRRPPSVRVAGGAETCGGLFDALEADGAETRFVGGCVRDSLLGRPVGDLDLATDAAAPRVLAVLRGAGIRVVPTGIGHGTVTAVVDGEPVQITTLRRDVETDGRRATVARISDWAEDAARRDFTINALSAERGGTVHDHVGGLADLAAGRVRFIGDPAERIAEDRLRILRFFRFHGGYARGPADADALAACAAAAAAIDGLSGQRLWNELSRILAAPEPAGVLSLMEGAGVLERLLPAPRRLDRVAALAALERETRTAPEPLRRLAALAGGADADAAARRLRLPRVQAARLRTLAGGHAALGPAAGETAARRAFVRNGGALFGELLLLARAAQAARDPREAARQAADWAALARIADAPPPRFPLSGADAIAAGIPGGPAVGARLREVEDWWIAEAFRPGRQACLDRLRRAARGRPTAT